MHREEKTKTIDELKEKIAGCKIGILADYRGLTTAQMNATRKKLKGDSIEFHVVKNSLAQFAAAAAGRDELKELFNGPVVLVLSGEDEVTPAKKLTEHIKAEKLELEVRAGFIADRVLSARDIGRLAELPPREVLIAQMLGNMQSPITGFVSILAAPIRGMMGVLQARVTPKRD